MRDLIFLDVETGGFDPAVHALLTVGLVHWVEGDVLDRAEFKVHSESRRVEADALRVNRIHLAAHNATALTRIAARDAIAAWMSAHRPPTGKPVIVGHNVAFDMAFMDNLFADVWSRAVHESPICTMQLYTSLQSAGRAPAGRRRLDVALKAFGIAPPDEDRHTALGDALAAAALYGAMLEGMQP